MRRLGVAMAVVTFGALASAKPFTFRREPVFAFAVDPALQDRGGAQYFFTLRPAETEPLRQPPFAGVASLLPERAVPRAPVHALLSRIVYTVDKDVAFFTRERTLDVKFMNAILPDGKIEARPDGTFRANKMPGNSMRIRFLGSDELAAPGAVRGLQTFLGLVSELGQTDSVVVQENYDFDRVLGVQTAAFSVTWTAHIPLEPGRTRVAIVTMSLLHNIPPFFLGGEERVHSEAVDGARALIDSMRRYRD